MSWISWAKAHLARWSTTMADSCTILAVLGLYAFHAITLCRSTRGAASTQARSQP